PPKSNGRVIHSPLARAGGRRFGNTIRNYPWHKSSVLCPQISDESSVWCPQNHGAPELAGDREALPASLLSFVEEQLHALYRGRAVVAEARAGAGVVQVEDRVQAGGLALVDVGGHA